MTGRGLFARLVATHLLVAAGVLLIAVLAQDQPAGRRATLVVVAFIGLGTLSLGLAAALARSVAAPIERVAGGIQRLSRGEFDALAPTGPRELRALVDAVNRLATDLAERVEQLRSETRLRERILSSMNEGVLLAERDRVVYANPAARELLGVEDGQALPATVPVPGPDGPASAEFALHHPAYREIRCTSTRVAGDTLLVVAQDVTDAKRVERIRRDFVANASHELKTPVAGILATAESLEDAMAFDPDTATSFARTLHKEANRLSNLVQDLLSLARLEQSLRPPGRVSLSEVVADAVDEVGEGGQQDIRVSSEIEPEVTVRGDDEDLALMVRNLLDNAIRYTPEAGSVTVTLVARDGRAVLTVADTGIGIPARDLPRIFERFYRVDKARSRDTGGTGLGLSIVRHVAESHGGTVTAESELGAGSVFTVTLPVDAG